MNTPELINESVQRLLKEFIEGYAEFVAQVEGFRQFSYKKAVVFLPVFAN